MPLRSIQIQLPRRVASYYLLFGLAAIVWLGFGVYHASKRLARDRSESACLRILGHVARSLNLEYLQNGPGNLQPLVERLRDSNRLAYLAVVAPNGEYLAHSSVNLVGTNAAEPAGASDSWGEAQRIRFVNEDSIVVQEFRAPLRARDERFGDVRLAIIEPGSWSTLWSVVKYSPFVLTGPLALMAFGAVAVGKLTRPIADIDMQLRVAAAAPTITGCELGPVDQPGPAAIGWNRLIQHWDEGASRSSWQEQLGDSLGTLKVRNLKEILNGLADGVATTDRSGRITFSNAALEALVPVDNPNNQQPGKAASDTEGKIRFVDAIAKQWTVPPNSPLLDAATELRPMAVELEGPTGQERRVLRVWRVPRNLSGDEKQQGHIWSLRDITQQRLAEETRNQFVDTATHELRTPLANIKAYAETLALADVTDVEQQKEFLNTINAEATRLARFVDDLLSVSSMEVGSLSLAKQTTDTARMLAEVAEKIRPQMDEKNLHFDAILPEKLPELALDKDKMAATLVNLLGNAVKYTPSGGSVVLRTTITEDQLCINIEDTGVGIAEDELPLVFDKFFRSDDARVQEETGTGLGLSLAKEVIRLHGGEVAVDSTLNEGTTFFVKLPIE